MSNVRKRSNASERAREAEAEAAEVTEKERRERSQLRLLMPSLPAWEMSVYTAAWVLLISYATYHVYLASGTYFYHLSSELDIGWFGPGRLRKDNSDPEWEVFSGVLAQGLPFMAIHFLGGQYLRKYSPHLLPAFYFLIGAIWIGKLIGISGVVFLLIQPVMLFAVKNLTGSDKLIYVVALGYKACENTKLMLALNELAFDQYDYHLRYIGSVTEAWINSRAMSCCLDFIWGDVPSAGTFNDFVKMLAHSFYMPVVVSGPIIRFKEFNDGLEAKYTPWNTRRIMSFAFLLARFSFWWVVAELILHFFYMSVMRYDLQLIKSVDLFTFAGIGYTVGQFFNLKYVIFYGFPRAFYFADNIEDIPTPRCICRVSHYSDMWRYFDVGLYRFMHKYFYLPLIVRRPGALMKLFASFLTFCFVYVWHGQQKTILIWSVLNFLGVTLEAAGKGMCEVAAYKRIERANLSPSARRRLYAAGSSLVFILAMISNLYFLLGGVAQGNVFADRLMYTWPYGTPIFLLTLYVGAQFSYEVRNWEIRRKLGITVEKEEHKAEVDKRQ